MNRKAKSVRIGNLLVLLVAFTSGLLAQRYVDVPAGYGTLNNVINADSTNRKANPNTIYRVHRGTSDSVYYLTSTLTDGTTPHTPLRIESSGTGALPAFIMATLSDGTPITPIISAKDDFSLKGVYIEGINTLGAMADRIIRIQSDSVTLRLDSVQFANSAQSFVRVDNTHAKIFLRNCRVGNIYSDWANARGVDNRGVTIDTLSMVGCSFYRLAFRVYRDGGGILNYGFFNHNTYVDIASSILGLGSAINITFVNNLAVNCQYLGTGVASAGRLVGITVVPGLTANIHHNVFYADTAALYAAYHAYRDTIGFAGWFADTLTSLINAAGLSGTNISSPVTFKVPPWNARNTVKTDSIVRWYWGNYSSVPPSTGDASISRIDSIRLVDLSYNTDAPAYTFSTDGSPVGATEWFGIDPLAVQRIETRTVPREFSLYHNYPNPFNPSTTIWYSLPHAGTVKLAVYDLFGREVRMLVNERQAAGKYRALFNASGIASGTYFCRLMVDGIVAGTNKMLFLK